MYLSEHGGYAGFGGALIDLLGSVDVDPGDCVTRSALLVGHDLWLGVVEESNPSKSSVLWGRVFLTLRVRWL